jgi:hypothetical protein
MNSPVRSGFAAIMLPAFLGLASLLALAACATSADYGYASGGVAYYDNDDYVYYPAYETYYSPVHHVYVYRDRDRWVRHSAPPHGFVTGSASVHMDFHDSPERHHSQVVHSYPRTWHQKSTDHHNDRDRNDDRKHHRDRDHDHDDRD